MTDTLVMPVTSTQRRETMPAPQNEPPARCAGVGGCGPQGGGDVTTLEQPVTGSRRTAARPKSADVGTHPAGEKLAERSVPRAARLVAAVHFDGAYDVAQITDGLDRDELVALAVVLAAMVDPEQSPADLLAWAEPPVSDDANAVYAGWRVADLRRAHAQRVKGLTDEWTVTGERLYQQRHARLRKARRHAGLMGARARQQVPA